MMKKITKMSSMLIRVLTSKSHLADCKNLVSARTDLKTSSRSHPIRLDNKPTPRFLKVTIFLIKQIALFV